MSPPVAPSGGAAEDRIGMEDRVFTEVVSLPPAGPPPRPANWNATIDEIEASGVLARLHEGRTLWWEHRYSEVTASAWLPGVCVYENRQGSAEVTYLLPEGEPACASEAEVRTRNVALAKAFVTDVRGHSPSRPAHTTITS